ncbi:hypothetical protein BofuT4_P075880.1 [Botrytis cinerea T4]|uniref:Uncharacterized protein n=1 Tax=Botryotinia fuckeliana (strain T4) TaxID=999810 RepID=G2XNP9_BOTF4|nr:hypothetical protein BofuT4_P075880.1 [Botrytis cinerea T4]
MNQSDYKGRRTAGMRGMSMDNILGDPFALATISIAMLAWFIAFIGSILATASHASNDGFPNYSWFTIAYMMCCILGIFVVIASDTTQTYHVAIVGFLATGLVLTSSSVNSLIYSSNGAKEAAAAGHILLSMVAIIWMFYFGSTPSAVPRAYLDSFALHKDHRVSSGRGMSTAYGNGYGIGRPDTSISSNVPPQIRIPRRCRRSRAQLITTKIWSQQSWTKWWNGCRAYTRRNHPTHRISIPSEGHLLLRCQPR